MNKFKKMKAFTLAEVLITLMVIGVLAVITIPSLLQSWQEQATVAKVRKVYDNLSQVYINVKREYGDDSYYSNNLWNYFQENLNVIQTCSVINSSGCLASSYIRLDGEPENYLWSDKNRFTAPFVLLQDGVAMAFYRYSFVLDDKNLNIPVIFVDVNGSKPPNQLGIDFFIFAIEKNRIIPIGGTSYTQDSTKNFNIVFGYGWNYGYACNKSGVIAHCRGLGCAGWIINKGNMDYLK